LLGALQTAMDALSTADRETVAHLVVPVGLGALTWLAVALTAGVVLTVRGLTPLLLLVGLVVAVLFLPVYRARPWEPGATGRVLDWAGQRRRALAVAGGLFALARLPVVSELLAPVLGLVMLPLRALPQVLYGARLFYDATVGPPAGQLLFELGTLYVEVVWLYGLGVAIAALVPRRDGGSTREHDGPTEEGGGDP
jgi:hypothetical protein